MVNTNEYASPRMPAITSMSIKELAAAYRVSEWTFKRWIRPFHKQIGEKDGWFYKPSQVKTIFEVLGDP